MPNNTPRPTVQILKDAVSNAKVIGLSDVNSNYTSRNRNSSVYDPIVKKILSIGAQNALLVDFGEEDFMTTRGMMIRQLVKKRGRKLHARRVSGSTYALWTSKA